VLGKLTHACARKGKQVQSTIVDVHVIQCRPAVYVGRVIVTDVTGVLVPRKLRIGVGKLDNEIFTKQIGLVPEASDLACAVIVHLNRPAAAAGYNG